MDFRNTALFVLIFLLGAVSVSLIYEVGNLSSRQAIDVITNPIDAITDTFSTIKNGQSLEQNSPGDHISENQIKVYSDRIELDIQDAVWSTFTDTNSMDPFLDEGANGIEITPQSEDDIQVGDIISYQLDESIIIHRVINISEDKNGTFYTVKGDNNPYQDPDKVRFSQILGILVGIIY